MKEFYIHTDYEKLNKRFAEEPEKVRTEIHAFLAIMHCAGYDCAGTIYPGAEIFKLKDQVGLPFSVMFELCGKQGVMIDWIGLIEAARAHDWWDYQIFDQIEEAFQDSQAWTAKRPEIINRIKQYMVKNIHPKMVHEI